MRRYLIRPKILCEIVFLSEQCCVKYVAKVVE